MAHCDHHVLLGLDCMNAAGGGGGGGCRLVGGELAPYTTAGHSLFLKIIFTMML